MKRTIIIIMVLGVSFLVSKVTAVNVNVTYTIDTEGRRTPISPYIYGANWGDWGLSDDENLTVKRLGGNRLTGYNWETNFSNAGHDWYHESDQCLVEIFDDPDDIPRANYHIPGITQTHFHDLCLKYNQRSVITLQMAGYVAADGNGSVSEAETAPSDRWKEVKPTRGSQPGSPNTSDDCVFMDEFVKLLVSKYGNASTDRGVKYYSLDNEPALWFKTHPRIHPKKVECVELVAKSIELAVVVKDVDPDAQILGPVLYGFGAYLDLNGAEDWISVNWNWGLSKYNWFIDYYLDEMRQAEQIHGKRLLDMLDLHWYTDVMCGGKKILESEPPYSDPNRQARMQAPRTLWDPDYDDQQGDWIHQWYSDYLPLLPTILESINTYYPGTKLSISEYSYGAPDDISGGIAIADVLGIFGKHGVYTSTYWHWTRHPGSNRDYVLAAFKIYRNYDGNNSTFGDTGVSAETTDKENSSIYASVFDEDDSELHIIVINRNLESPIDGTFNITSQRSFTSGKVWSFNGQDVTITEITPVEVIVDNSFSYTVGSLAVCHIVLKADDAGQAVHDAYANYLVDSWITASLQDPFEWCLGAPDEWSVALGDGGWIVLDMGLGEAVGDGDGADLVVYEDPLGFWDEGYAVYGSNESHGPWTLIGTGVGTQEFDLADRSGLQMSRYIKVWDDNDWPWTWPWEGYDIDAVEALNMEQ